MYPLVFEITSSDSPVRVSVKVASRVLGFSKQAYYKWLRKPVSDRDAYDLELLKVIREIHEDDPEFGYRFITDELRARGYIVGEGRVNKICSRAGIHSCVHNRKRSLNRSAPASVDDLIRRKFKTDAPNQVWLTDITEHPTMQGKVYVCAIKDVFSNRIVGLAISDRMQARLATDALRNAINARGGANIKNCIVHSDRGGQFRSRAYLALLQHYKLKQSMGQVQTCADNAAMESFFSLLQRNVFNKKTWRTRHELRHATNRWINTTYHTRRRQRSLGKLTPVEYELIMI